MTLNNNSISIEKESCIQCGKCVRVCPSGIMSQEKRGEEIGLKHIQSCIVCGHCVDVCPTDSVIHSAFPPEKTHVIDYTRLPSPEQVMLLIKSRRSNRAITSKPVPQKMLEQIVEAARYAPTASNKQQVSFTLVTDPVKLRQISDFTIKKLSSTAKILTNPLVKGVLKPFLRDTYHSIPALYRLKQEHEAGNDPILRKSTAVLIFHTPESNGFGCEDANLAYQNASLMAQSLGVSQIYMGFVVKAIQLGGKNEFSQLLGIEGKVQAVMALGIPAFNYAKYTERYLP
ncbi:MAG: nitroreductase family protein [Parabacteroides sp.]|nr:nitroreductase family protein [Parabacteroides sp.]